jgi:Protein of unknown function (DUF2690)/Helix-turn-helix domain
MTGRWRPLPGTLDPEVAYLVGVLRELKDRSGLSLAALGAKTAYSKSSWERYLNGAKLPPRHAVESLGRLVGEPVERLLALWERAEVRWSGRAAAPRSAVPQEPAAQPRPAGRSGAAAQPGSPTTAGPVQPGSPTTAGPVPGPAYRRERNRPPGWVWAAVAGCAGVAVLAAVTRPLGVLGGSAPSGSPTPPGYSVGCRGTQCAGGDPEAMACAIDAASYAKLRVAATYLELRISDQCRAAWARVSHSTVGERVLVMDTDGRTEAVTVPDDAATARYVHTPMITADRHSQVRACVEPRGGVRQCTPWGASSPGSVPPAAHPPASPLSSAR